MLKLKAYAKINLTLDVLGKRPNGYHDVKMIMQTIDLYDELCFKVSKSKDINLKTEYYINGELQDNEKYGLSGKEDNLIYKAAKAIMTEAGINEGIDIELKKYIPVAAGMAGGSTDAAATLKAVNELFNIGYSEEKLCEIGAKLGADIPYCIMGGTVLAEGIGEKLTRLKDVPTLYLAIVKPTEGISTKYVYEHLDALSSYHHPDTDSVIKSIEEQDAAGVVRGLENVLELVTIPVLPKVEALKKLMLENGALGTLMSGSGPTVFACFENAEKAKIAAKAAYDSSLAEFATSCTTVTP